MAAEALRLLEFPELLALISRYVGSPLGQARLQALSPVQDTDAMRHRQALAAEAREYLRLQQSGKLAGELAGGSPGDLSAPPQTVSFTGFGDPSTLLSKLGVEGMTLELAEISALLGLAEGVLEIRRALLSARRRFPELAGVAERLGDFQELLKHWRGKILPNGELDDRASPGLQRIRREIEKQRGVILSSLRSLMRSLAEDSPSQDEIVTVRGDRFVVPVRVAKRSQVKGVVHGSSSSGQTVYMEPLETIEMNNDLVRLREEELREIYRILQAMTAALRERGAELSVSADCIGVLDLAFACGRFAKDYDCVIPRFTSGDGPVRLRLQDARHPLLESLFRSKGMTVVPVSVEFPNDARALVISGPNTGGKTVALKTVGLLAMMALAGLPIPAEEAEFPLFDRILADIGDSQSIQESLSTFSAHLVNIAAMMAAATPDSLILLDELGSATDPEEAGALGVAVVDRFRSIGAFTLASTHHMALKAYAANTPGVLSANMGFDEDTLAPTYHLEIGRPGKSSGIAMAERLGLPHEVVERARQSLSATHHEVEQFLARLKSDAGAASQMRADFERRLAQLDRREREWNEAQHKRELERAAAWQRELDALLTSLEERAEQKLSELASQVPRPMRSQEVSKRAAQVTSKFRQQAQDDLRQTLVSHLGGAGEGRAASALNPPAHLPVSLAVPPRRAAVGDSVRLKSLGKTGVVRSKSGDWLEVEIGLLRTRVTLDDIEEVIPAPAQAAAAKAARVHVTLEPVTHGSLSEINVIGDTADEARRRVDKFLDNAYLASLTRVRVVHGSGKGILRKSLAEMFAEHPHVEKFSPAPQEEGGAGATIVELKA
ncbi:MAG: Smr/MutS family protein [Acidobacteria bacterium]|nr:Smr/MutS family protein [Acidobacteriota bacterium]